MNVSKEYIAELGKVALLSTDKDNERLVRDISRTLEAGETLTDVVSDENLTPTFQMVHAQEEYFQTTPNHPDVKVEEFFKNVQDSLVVVTNEKSKESNE